MAAALPDRWHRLVNDADVVPRVPPNYRHAGHLLHFDGEGRVTSPSAVARSAGGGGAEEAALNAREAPTADSMLSPEAFQALQEQLRTGATSRGLERGFNLIGDHMLPGYLSRIRQQIS
jgi:hypothetical protein